MRVSHMRTESRHPASSRYKHDSNETQFLSGDQVTHAHGTDLNLILSDTNIEKFESNAHDPRPLPLVIQYHRPHTKGGRHEVKDLEYLIYGALKVRCLLRHKVKCEDESTSPVRVRMPAPFDNDDAPPQYTGLDYSVLMSVMLKKIIISNIPARLSPSCMDSSGSSVDRGMLINLATNATASSLIGSLIKGGPAYMLGFWRGESETRTRWSVTLHPSMGRSSSVVLRSGAVEVKIDGDQRSPGCDAPRPTSAPRIDAAGDARAKTGHRRPPRAVLDGARKRITLYVVSYSCSLSEPTFGVHGLYA
ncbi:hypothetical protein EVAR_17292_1 [Eumeta japonica]|uniref:Uncharacterized protein n=1 Tax=Eumeta variegata TaxID=151549 RepID=A0A4C1TT27_EUMVA|nr:hypothetical protein EVAR_17292_1 [Eumeta japonica]